MSSPRTSWPLGPALHRLLGAASVLVAVAGFQLFVLSDHTDRWFAWTIGEPLTAATLGALYWASFVTVRFVMRERTWATARGPLLGVQSFTLLTMVATLLHLGTFHLSGGPASAVLAGWAWLIVYVTVPLALLALLVRGARSPERVEVERGPRMPAWFRAPVVAIGTGIALTGVVLFVAPGTAERFWPWTLTGLTSQALGAWWVGVGITMAVSGWDGDLRAARGPMVTAAVLGPLLLAGLIRYRSHVDWSRPGSAVYLATSVVLLVMGVAGLVLARRTAAVARSLTADRTGLTRSQPIGCAAPDAVVTRSSRSSQTVAPSRSNTARASVSSRRTIPPPRGPDGPAIPGARSGRPPGRPGTSGLRTPPRPP